MLSDDALPQPYRFLNKLVSRCVDDAFELIRGKIIAEQSHRKFAPPRSLVRSDMPTEAIVPCNRLPGGDRDAAAAAAGSHCVTASNTVFGFPDGRAAVYSSQTAAKLGVYDTRLEHASGITSVAACAAHGVFAAATPSEAVVFYAFNEATVEAKRVKKPEVLRGDDEPEADEADDDADTGPKFGRHCHVPESALQGRGIAAVEISDDGSFVALALSSADEVLVFRLPDPTAAVLGDADQATPPAAELLLSAPVGLPVVPGTVVIPLMAFLCDDAVTAAMATAVRSKAHTPLAHTLCIAWAGTNAFATYALRQFLGSADTARVLAEQAKAAADGTVRDVKEAGKKEDAKAKKGAAAVADAPAAVPPVPVDAIFCGWRRRLLPALITTASVCRNAARHDLLAIGCCDGVTVVWSSALCQIVHCFNAAPHREAQLSVRPMAAVSVSFYGASHLVVAHSHPGGAITSTATDHSHIVVYDLGSGARMHSLDFSIDFLPRLSFVVASARMPVMAFVAGGTLYVADLLCGALICELPGSELAASADLQPTTDLNAVVAHCAAVRSVASCVGEGMTAVSAGPEGRRGHLLDFADLVLQSYPVVRQYFGAASADELGHVLAALPEAADRHNAAKVGAVQLPSHHALTGHHGASEHGASKAGSQLPPAGPRSTQSLRRSSKSSGGTTDPRASKKASSHAGGRTGARSPDGRGAGRTAGDAVHRMVGQREVSRHLREQRVKALLGAAS
jgi:hypothetical protein